MAIESEMLADAGRYGLRVKEVPIGVRYDVDGSTENPVRHRLAVLLKIIKDIEHNKPLYSFTLPGSILRMVGLYMGLIFFTHFLPWQRSGIRAYYADDPVNSGWGFYVFLPEFFCTR
ncbi:hypothetical protein [Methanosarcina horonobensis]|uniref:hypothetical protein n=1 Tax=Methanosarcina horonobensis TaxID=418008 RepID=UPI000A508915|nr:hypothetical protein [Methanosarcina horonobensis]